MPFTLVYDSGCGPCTAFRKAVGFLDPRHRLVFSGIADAERRGLLADIEPGLRYRSFHLVSPTADVESGPEAFSDLSKFLPGGPLLSRALVSGSFLSQAASSAYGVLARLHERGACAPADAPVRSRLAR